MRDELKVEDTGVSIHLTLGEDVEHFECKQENLSVIVYGYPYHDDRKKWLTAEGILELYQKKGLSFTNCIDGAFSIIILGREKVLITDPIGVYNLFLLKKKDRVLVSNQLEYLIQHEPTKSVDEKGINDFIYLGYVIGENTIFTNIKKAKPGSIEYLDYPNKVEKYFEITDIKSSIHKLKKSFNSHIELGIGLNDKIILPLTAGLDSRVVLSKLIKNNYENFSTFTHETNNLDDIKTAKQIAKKLNFTHSSHVWKDIFVKKYVNETENIFQAMLNSYLFIPLYGSHKIAKQYGDTLWNGNGGELFREYYNLDITPGYIEKFIKKNLVTKRIVLPSYHYELLRSSFVDELKRLEEINNNVLKLYYLYYRYANFSGYSLKMSGRIMKVFQPFISKDNINYLLNLSKSEIRKEEFLKKVILENESQLCSFKLNNYKFSGTQHAFNTYLRKVKAIYGILTGKNRYVNMPVIFGDDYRNVINSPHEALKKYVDVYKSIKYKKMNYYFITNLMTIDRYLKKVL